MLIGLCAAAILFPICLFLWWIQIINVVPWAHDAVSIKGIFICFGSIFVPMFPGVFAYICHRKGAFYKAGNRIIGTFLVGATLGLFVSASDAIFHENATLREIHTENFERILCGGRVPNEICEPARKLISKAEVLSMLMRFVDTCSGGAIEYAIFALLTILLYDKINVSKQMKSQA